MAKRDYYEVLGLSKGASADDIKRSYRKLAKEFHPDHNPGDSKAVEKFKEIQEAYDTLGDSEKRAQYDQFGRAGVGSVQTGPGGSKVYSWGGGESKINVEDLEELLGAFGRGPGHASIFDQIFGGGQRGGYTEDIPTEPAVIEQEVHLTFDQAIQGTRLTLQQTDGSGRPGQKLDVKIPPGVREGQRIRIRGQQSRGRATGPTQDIHLICRIQPHAYFRREGDDIFLEVPISLTEAAIGAEVEVPTLDGRATVKIPPGSRSGMKLRLKGRGVAHSGDSARGDFYAIIQIIAPRNLTPDQIAQFQRLGEELGEHPRVGLPWAK